MIFMLNGYLCRQMNTNTKILDARAIDQKINRLAWQVYEDNLQNNEVLNIGICGRGEILASKLAKVISQISSIKITVATLSLDKDNPYDANVFLDLDIADFSNKVIILVDDVLNSGKTLIYASKYFLNSPLVKLSTVVLVDRNHNRFPIKSDYVGLSLATTLQEYISVVLEGKRKGVYLS